MGKLLFTFGVRGNAFHGPQVPSGVLIIRLATSVPHCELLGVSGTGKLKEKGNEWLWCSDAGAGNE